MRKCHKCYGVTSDLSAEGNNSAFGAPEVKKSVTEKLAGGLALVE